MSFFTELKRRNVFRVAAAYAVVAWLLITGFPLAIFLACAFELTPEGVKRADAFCTRAGRSGGPVIDTNIVSWAHYRSTRE